MTEVEEVESASTKTRCCFLVDAHRLFGLPVSAQVLDVDFSLQDADYYVTVQANEMILPFGSGYCILARVCEDDYEPTWVCQCVNCDEIPSDDTKGNFGGRIRIRMEELPIRNVHALGFNPLNGVVSAIAWSDDGTHIAFGDTYHVEPTEEGAMYPFVNLLGESL